MMGNSILNKAKYSSNNTDEWYTDYKTIENEISHYESQFNGKKVLCNCDDPYESSFAKYFLKHFNRLKLKKLVCISYAKSVMHSSEDDRGLILVVEDMPVFTKKLLNDSEILEILNERKSIKKLEGDGDFRSEECVRYLKDSDIVVTNPPFSKFTELFSLIVKYDKQYLLISNQNAITYKEIFPYIKNNQARVGYHFGDMAFKVPDDTEPRKTRFWIDHNGKKWRSLGNACWYTNLDIQKRHEPLDLIERYDPEKYPKFDNYDAINVDKTLMIPSDYKGVMGVPVTMLQYYCPDQFEIIGHTHSGDDDPRVESLRTDQKHRHRGLINGKQIYDRILIKRK